jgi:hypothetical protein
VLQRWAVGRSRMIPHGMMLIPSERRRAAHADGPSFVIPGDVRWLPQQRQHS